MMNIKTDRRREDFGQKAERRLRRWILRKTISFITGLVVIAVIILMLLYFVTNRHFEAVLAIVSDGTRQVGSALLSSLRNTTAGG